jgi:hypothetical protein
MQPTHAVLMCNDKAYRGYEDFLITVQAALGAAYAVTVVHHGREILGREPAQRDPWYDPPRVLQARRRERETRTSASQQRRFARMDSACKLRRVAIISWIGDGPAPARVVGTSPASHLCEDGFTLLTIPA